MNLKTEYTIGDLVLFEVIEEARDSGPHYTAPKRKILFGLIVGISVFSDGLKYRADNGRDFFDYEIRGKFTFEERKKPNPEKGE